jgi:hypothetical protein
MIVLFDKSAAGIGDSDIQNKGKLLLTNDDLHSRWMVEGTMFFETDPNFSEVMRFDRVAQALRRRSRNHFMITGFKKGLRCLKVIRMAHRDIVGFAQGIESQGYGLLPYGVVCQDRLFAEGCEKG